MQPLPQDDAKPRKKTRRANVAQLGRDLAYKALRSQGVSQEQAAIALGLHKQTGYRIERRLKEQAQETGQPDPIQPLLSAARDLKLGRLVDHFLDKGVKIRKVKGSDAIAAGKLYAERRYPVRMDPAPPAVSYTQVNLIEIRNPDPTRYGVPAPRDPAADSPDDDKPPTTLDISPIGDGTVMSIMSNEGCEPHG